MATSLGFRPPQFSEDVAWLPDWLRQHDSDSYRRTGGGTYSVEPVEAFPFLQKDISAENDANMSIKDECKCQSFHLLLSGEENSVVSFAPSSDNVVCFHLQLSLDTSSQLMASTLMDTSQAERPQVNDVISLQQVETSACHEARENAVDNYVNMVNLSCSAPCQTLGHVVCQSVANGEDSGMKHDENTRNFEIPDVSDAVEMSIAASEALVIHEIVKSGPSGKYLPTVSILEIALGVKQARFEVFKNSHCLTADTDETDCLSDLDEFSMASAYEDVGLSISSDNLCDSDSDSIISEVKETPISEIHLGCKENNISEVHRDLVVGCVDTGSGQHYRDAVDIDIQQRHDLALEIIDGESEKNLIGYPSLGTNPSLASRDNEAVMQCSVLANSDVPATTKFQENVKSSPCVRISEDAEKSEELRNEVERFQSRWLGGWTLKEVVNTSAAKEVSNAKSIPKLLVGETSYLSESADIAPDENSFVQKHDKDVYRASQSSIGFCNHVNHGVMISPDAMGSFNLSLVDPLCSVVPCSLSAEDPCSTLEQHLNDKIDAGKCFSPAPEHGFANMETTLSQKVVLVDGEQESAPICNSECSNSAVSRRLTSLRALSMGFSDDDSVEKGRNNCNNSKSTELSSGFLCSKKNLAHNADCIGSPPFKYMFTCTAGGLGEYHKMSEKSHPVTDFTNKKQYQYGNEKERAEFHVQLQKERSSPLILNQKSQRHFQASKIVEHNFNEKENLKQNVGQEPDILVPCNRSFQLKQFKCKSTVETEVPARKRVRFSEPGTELLQKNDLHKFQFTHRNGGSTAGAIKRTTRSNAHSELRAQAVKRRQTVYPSKAAKKIFRDVEFLLTGFSRQKRIGIECLVRKYGGIVLSDIPCLPKSRGNRFSRYNYQQLPVVLCHRKLETTEFLYGCAVNACILKVNWLKDSIAAGSVLPPEKYMILPNHVGEKCVRIGKPRRHINNKYIFDGAGIMLHGKHSFYTKLAKVVKHGGGLVFKTLQWLIQSVDAQQISIAVIVAEDESSASRHLKHCASEQNIPVMPVSWIINSLYEGTLLPLAANNYCSRLPTMEVVPDSMDSSEEI